METGTKSKTTFWLLDQSPPLIDGFEKHNFVGAHPPTQRQILLNFSGNHEYHQANNIKLQSSTTEFIKLAVQDKQNRWAKTGIQLNQSCNGKK